MMQSCALILDKNKLAISLLADKSHSSLSGQPMTEQSNLAHHEKIKRVAGRLKITVWVFCAAITTIFLMGLIFGQPSVEVNKDLVSEEAKLALVAMSLYPDRLFAVVETLQLLMVVFLMFWLQRLLAFFEKGQYFSNQSVSCCLWIAWIFVTLLIVPFIQKSYLYYLCYRFLPELDVPFSIELNLGSLVLIVLLPMVIYMLRIAQTLELENKEFV